MTLVRKVYALLTPAQRWASAGFFVLAVTSSVVELFGIGLIVLLLQSLAVDRPSGLIARLEPLLHVVSFGTAFDAQINLILILSVAYLIRLGVALAYSDLRIRLITSVQHSAMRRIYRGVMAMPYEAYGRIEPSAILTALWKVCPRVSRNLLNSMLVVVVESILTISIVIATAIQEPLTTLGIGLAMAIVYGLVQAVTHRRLRINGAAETTSARRYQKLVLDSFRGFREVRIYGLGRLLDRRHEELLDEELALQREARKLGEAPRPIIETAIVYIVLSVVLAQLVLDVPKAEFASRMLVLAVCIARLMPSANRLSVAWSGVSHNIASIDELNAIFERYPDQPSFQDVSDEPFANGSIKLDRVDYSYPDSGPALQSVSLTIEKGSMVGFIGGSGSGKTTLLEIIAGLLTPTQGRVVVGDLALSAANRARWLATLGYVPQSTTLIGGSILENIAFGRPIDLERIQAAVTAAQLDTFCSGSRQVSTRKLANPATFFPEANVNGIGLARALYGKPQVLILDEATSALDVNTEAAVLSVLDGLRGSITIIVVAHRLSAVAGCDVVHWLESGALMASGPYARVVADMAGGRPAIMAGVG